MTYSFELLFTTGYAKKELIDRKGKGGQRKLEKEQLLGGRKQERRSFEKLLQSFPRPRRK